MPYGNNALSKDIRRNKRQCFIDVAMNTKTVIDYLTFDLSSYFRVQFVVMFVLKDVPFNLREFCLAAYYLQSIGELCYTKRLFDICPHIKRTTVDNMNKYGLITDSGTQKTKSGQNAKTFVLHHYYYGLIDEAMKKGSNTIRDANFHARAKAAKNTTAKQAENTTEADAISSFLDNEDFDFLGE